MQEGQKIRDYVLEEKIGEGGMGEVWRARHIILKREVAIKAMAPHLETDPEFGRRFLQEAQEQARLDHPRIVGVSDFFAEDGQYFLVMSLMSGKSLADRLHELHGPLPVSDALAVARDVLDALDYAHQQGVIHRDVKPSNILLDREGHACLTDFGIALSLGRRHLTQTVASFGTPHYMSPEQIQSPRSVDHRTDVYSFGCVLYEMLTGRPPFVDAAASGDTDFALKEAHIHRVPESLRKWNPKVPAWLDAIVLRALAKNPDERFSGCGEFRRTLDAPPSSAAAVPEPVRVVRKPGPAPARGGRLPAALIALALVVVAVLAFFAFRQRPASGEPADEMMTDLAATTTEPMTTEPVGIVELPTRETAEPQEPATTEPMETDLASDEPAKSEKKKDAATTEPLVTDAPRAEPAVPEPAVPPKKKKKGNETREPLTTEKQDHGGALHGGVVPPPMDTDLGTDDPLGTDMAPPPTP
ncbi:MAG TPA: serine/threonine-protein kinase [Thermoanaerobaculia bacterium]|nr:serine/threonine-protein kinase [Thermoanaerobaculia bacterium]